MAVKAAERGRVPPFIAMEVLRAANERAAAGADIAHLEVGQPGTSAPAGVLEAARAALGTDQLGYTEAMGIAPLRARIAQHYRDFYELELPPERIIVTVGSSGAFLLAFLAAFEHGNRIAMAAPGYPAYRNILTALGNEPATLRTTAADRFQPSVAHLQRLEAPVDGLIVASPSNPTGTMLAHDEFARLAAYCTDHGIRLISDEIYHGITYGQPPVCALTLSDDVIVVNSFSKYFSMTGWRLGWMVVPPDLMQAVDRLAQNLFISAPTLSQRAALAAFDCTDELRANVARYARNREILLRELPKVGLDNLAPADGAFYIYADIARITNDSPEFCRRMLAEAGVAATPGTDFDPQEGRHYVRFSFAGSIEDIESAVRRLRDWRR